MPPKTKFTKEEIVQAAFDIAQEKGFGGVSARNVAKHLKSSVAPIYVNFATIDDLLEAVVQRIFAISNELVARQQGADQFANIGKASLAFAREYPVLFRELVMQPNPYMASYETMENAMVEAMGEDEDMKDWTVAERRNMFFKMRVFQLGLSAMVANGHVPSWLDDQAVEAMLLEVGADFLLVQQMKRREHS